MAQQGDGSSALLNISLVLEPVASDPYSPQEIIEKYGQARNVEQPEHFNRQSLAFLSSQTVVA
ncbi:hypothetical protein [Aeromonas bivalvium]|uniref:hypothetical protein n=1 Tax=Aeromonas bivalvium TaxID=440079 RepID=UPI0038D10417